MNYSILMEVEKLGLVLNELEKKVDYILVSMDKFNKLWNGIYQSYKNNNFENPRSFDSMVISVYNDWKDKSDIIRQIEECVDYILHELKAAKKNKILSKSIIVGINQEVQNLSNTVNKFEIDKNAIHYLAKKYQKSKQQQKFPAKSVLSEPLYNRIGVSTITSVFLVMGVYHAIQSSTFSNIDKYFIGRGGLAVMTSAMSYSYGTKKAKRWIFNYNLSRLSQSSIEMNTELRNFGLLVSTEIRRVETGTGRDQETNYYSAAFDIEVDGLIKIIQKLGDCFNRIQDQTSQNENNARDLVLKRTPRFLIKN
ncbi:hypothetical protein EDC94DRAFT_692997 [Helicostylum pulchrum]|nr:hypothetical protein EDC94DRAFT_692997 [Helicostylum pulchrum]